MTSPPGQEPGHRSDALPMGYSWDAYVDSLVHAEGSLAAVAAGVAAMGGYAWDVNSVERGLRRLRARGHHDGGVWGQRLLRRYGLPRVLVDRVQWMGQYHTRFTDLPRTLCVEMLRLWQRPPVSESPARIWLDLGLAGVALRTRDLQGAVEHLQRAEQVAGACGPAATLELALTRAYVASREEPSAVAALLERAKGSLQAPDLSDSDRACYFARWIDQRAYELNKRLRGSTPDHAAALALYESIPTVGAPPFAMCRRENGIAWTKYHLGHRDEAVSHARAAVRHAGDGGSLRMRGMALNFLARALEGDEAEAVRQRALEIAAQLEDEELRLRLIR